MLAGLILITVLFSAFFSGMEIAYISANKLRLELDIKQGTLSSRILSLFSTNPGQYIVTMLIGNNIALVMYGILMAAVLDPALRQFLHTETWILILQTIISTLIILVLAEFLPKAVFRLKPNDFLKWLGIDELFLADQSFGSHQAHSQKVMELLARYGFSYTTFVRPDHPEQFWKELKDSGCHTVIMGVESANEEILTSYQKGYGLEEIKMGVRQAQEQGLRVVATVIIGLPEDTRESILKTMRFLRELEPDFVSYNLAVARNLTEFKAEAFRQGLVLSPEMDQAGNLSRIRTRALGSEELLKLKKRAIRDFYLRPGYIFKKLVEARSWFEVYALFREGIAVLLKNL